MILAGDIGGTNTRLALFEAKSLKPLKGSLTKFPSGQHGSLEEILELYIQDFLPDAGFKKIKLKGAGFGVAGPVRDGKVKTTNLPWQLDSKKLAKELGVKSVALRNDLYATAAGIEVLPKKAFVTLRAGLRPKLGGNRAVVAPGTGLGHAALVLGPEEEHIISPSEAGHCEFAPTTDLEQRLLKFIAAKDDPAHGFFKRCSYENIVSGPGMRNLYEFLVESEGYRRNEAVERAEMKDRAGLISQAGLENTDKTCVQALEMFVTIFGRQAGNFALSVLAIDGIYLGGGIPPKILAALKHERFLSALSSKGSQHWMETVPVQVITDDLCALYGAANCGANGR